MSVEEPKTDMEIIEDMLERAGLTLVHLRPDRDRDRRLRKPQGNEIQTPDVSFCFDLAGRLTNVSPGGWEKD